MMSRGKPKPEGIENMGKQWLPFENQLLLEEVRNAVSFEDIAKAHKRTTGGITSRLYTIAYELYNNNTPINEIVAIVRLDKNDIIDRITRRDYAIEQKSIASKAKAEKLITRQEDSIISNKSQLRILHPSGEMSELKEILRSLKVIEARVFEYIKERTIFDTEV